MDISVEDIFTLLLRKQRFSQCLDELMGVIDGSTAQISSIIGVGSRYSDTATLRFIDDIIGAYNNYPMAEGKRGLQEMGFADDEYLDSDFWDVPDLLDADQRRLVKSMLYCLIRILADNPFYQYHHGTFSELKRECAVLLGEFARGVSKKEVWYQDVERYVLSDGKPRSSAELAQSYNLTYRDAPRIGTEAYFEWYGYLPLLDYLTTVYEALSGKHVAESIPEKRRLAIMEDAEHYSYLKKEMLYRLTDAEAEAALRQGWLDEDDLKKRAEYWTRAEAELLADIEDAPDAENREWDSEADEDSAAAEKRRLAKWVDGFPCKNTWCKHFLTMRNAYFKLGGINPRASGFDEDENQDLIPINADYLSGAIDAVLNQRSISHFMDDAYLGAIDGVRRATVRARRYAARGR